MEPSSKIIGIAGLGLIGGSIARALNRVNGGYSIKAWDKDESNINSALAQNIIHEQAINLKKDFSDCDIVFLCVPVFAMKDILVELKDSLKENCVLTDVGSTKSDVASLIKQMNINNPFVGGHPLAGSEKSGFAASRANLFENAYYCLTPDNDTNRSALNTVREIIIQMGAIPLEMSPEDHDRITAAISHVPHIMAALLVNMVDRLDGPDNKMKTIAAGGFKDLTRIASSSPELWSGICLSNKDMIIDTLECFRDILDEFEADLSSGHIGNIEQFFRLARNVRDNLSEGKSIYQKTFDIVVDVEDKPGIIAVIATALADRNINIKNIGIIHSRDLDEGALEIRFEDEESRQKGLDTLETMGYSAKARG